MTVLALLSVFFLLLFRSQVKVVALINIESIKDKLASDLYLYLIFSLVLERYDILFRRRKSPAQANK